MDTIKIYIVEDSSIIRDNLTDALRESAPIEVVGCAEEERSASVRLSRMIELSSTM